MSSVSVSGMSSLPTIMAIATSALVWQLYWPLPFLLPLHIAILAIAIGLIGNCRTPPTVVPTLTHTINTIITATSFSACFKCFNFPIFVTCLQVCQSLTLHRAKSLKASLLLFDNKEKEELLVKAPTNDNKGRRVSPIKGGQVTTFAPDFSLL